MKEGKLERRKGGRKGEKEGRRVGGRREEQWEGGGKQEEGVRGRWIHTKTPGFRAIPYFSIQNQTRKQEPLK